MPCRECGQYFDVDVWTIVDIDERPDLLVRLRDGTLHDLICPNCGHPATVNTPLLIVRPDAKPVLLFSPAKGSTRDQDEEQVEALVGMLRQHLGVAWRDEWLEKGVTGVPRESLPLILGDDPAAAGGLEAATTHEEDVPLSIRSSLESILAELAAEGVRVNSAEDLRQAIESRPEMKATLIAALKDVDQSHNLDADIS
jgi:hypothetical protein